MGQEDQEALHCSHLRSGPAVVALRSAPCVRQTPGCERLQGQRGSAPADDQASKELSRAGGRAPVRREHVQFASHPYYG